MKDSVDDPLIGPLYAVKFTLLPHKWPIDGWPDDVALVIIEAIMMPLIKMRSYRGGRSVWVNASIIETMRFVRNEDKSVGESEIKS